MMNFNMETPNIGEENNSENKPESKEQDFEFEEAKETLEKELSIPKEGSEKEIKNKIDKAVESKSFLEKIRDNSKVKKALKIALLGIALIKAEPALSQDTQINEKSEDKIEHVQKEKYGFQENLNLLSDDEHIVPQNVMVAFAEVVDPNAIGVPAGGYFSRNFLDTKEKLNKFESKLDSLGYSKNQKNSLEELFTSDDVIVFNQSELEKNDFKKLLAHEKLHKKINHLDEDRRKKLNKARDFILQDFAEKRGEWAEKTDTLWQKFQDGEFNRSEWAEKVKEAKLSTNPILKNKDGGVDDLYPITRNEKEFYTYLMMGELHESVLDHVKENFPESYEILMNLQEEIENEIEK